MRFDSLVADINLIKQALNIKVESKTKDRPSMPSVIDEDDHESGNNTGRKQQKPVLK